MAWKTSKGGGLTPMGSHNASVRRGSASNGRPDVSDRHQPGDERQRASLRNAHEDVAALTHRLAQHEASHDLMSAPASGRRRDEEHAAVLAFLRATPGMRWNATPIAANLDPALGLNANRIGKILSTLAGQDVIDVRKNEGELRVYRAKGGQPA